MKLYGFDDTGTDFEFIPLAARRSLDVCGLKLSRDGWRSLPLELRRAVIDAGSGPEVDAETVRRVLAKAVPAPESVSPAPDPPAAEPALDVTTAFGAERPIASATWSALSALDRYALAKVAARGRADRIARAYEEIVGASALTPHLGPDGAARMVGVGDKPVTRRSATARSRVVMNTEAWTRLASSTAPKGDVLATARLAGILAAKRTHELIPLCHPLRLTRIDVQLSLDEASSALAIEAGVEAQDRTGVEMEALVAASVAALTVYDMLKAFDRSMLIGPTELVAKSGGRSGDYRR